MTASGLGVPGVTAGRISRWATLAAAGRKQTKDLEDPKHRFPSHVEAFAAAAQDLEDNWDDYRERMKKPKK